MNERDKEIREMAWVLVSDEERERNELYETRERWERCDQKFADLIRADEREAIFNIVQKIAARFYKDATEEAFDELTDAILLRGNT